MHQSCTPHLVKHVLPSIPEHPWQYSRTKQLAGTLAYGINMPCRTVAFAGDHIWLNALQFNQMSGRAGRRGFDNLGHVIFMEVPQHKVASLMTSPVPNLHGNFPLSVPLALRALTLQAAARTDPQVTNDMLRLLQKPFRGPTAGRQDASPLQLRSGVPTAAGHAEQHRPGCSLCWNSHPPVLDRACQLCLCDTAAEEGVPQHL